MEVLDQIEASLFHSAATHISATLERLLSQRPAPDPAEAPPANAQELDWRAQAAVKAAFERRLERLLDPQGELARSLETALRRLDGPLGEAGCLALLEILRMPDGGGPGEEGSPATEEGGTTPLFAGPAAPHLSYTYLADELLVNTSPDEIAHQSMEHLLGAQQALKDDLGVEALSEAYRQLLLGCIDERWVEYLTRLEELRYEVRLEGMAHNDPLVMYKSKASSAYRALLTELRQVAVAQMFRFLPGARLVGTSEASSLEKATPKLTFLKLG
jgi:hypothetical protein